MEISVLLDRHGFRSSQIYLLEIIPIIETMWADGKNQSQELIIIKKIVQRHLRKLEELSHGITVVSQDDVNDFLKKLTTKRPDPQLMADLRQVAIERQQSINSPILENKSILEYCLDVASACVKSYPYEFDERIVAEEKKLIWDLLDELSIDKSYTIDI